MSVLRKGGRTWLAAGAGQGRIAAVNARRAIALVLFAAGCFGLGLAVARWLGWGPATPAPPALPSGVGTPGAEPLIYIDAGAIELHDGSLSIDPPRPPNVELK